MTALVRNTFAVLFAVLLARPTGAIAETGNTTFVDISLADGIDENEAARIGDAYYAVNTHCGSFAGVSDGGAIWILRSQSSFSGTEADGASIDKATGRIVSSTCRSYTSPKEILAPDIRRAGT